jgi:hypothetical protein
MSGGSRERLVILIEKREKGRRERTAIVLADTRYLTVFECGGGPITSRMVSHRRHHAEVLLEEFNIPAGSGAGPGSTNVPNRP